MNAAVEAGARAWFDRIQSQRRDVGRKRPNGRLWQWDDLTEHDKRAYRALVRPIVKAVENEWLNRPGPELGGIGLTDEESASYWEAIKGA